MVSIVGLVWAVRAARGAQSAAQAAAQATRETRDRTGRDLVVVDLERAVALIQRLKLLHRDARWDAALEQYQALRWMLSAILSRYPDWESESRTQLTEARTQVSVMEGLIEQHAEDDVSVDYRTTFIQQLNETQSALEEMASTLGVRSEGGGI